MVGDATGMAGAGVGAEGFFAGVNIVAGKEEWNAEDAHSRTHDTCLKVVRCG